MNPSRTPVTRTLILMLVAMCLTVLGVTAHTDDITQQELLQRLDAHEAPLIVDVRRADEFAAGHIPDAVNIPHTEIAARLAELRAHQHREVVVYCEGGRRAAIARRILERAGFTQVRHLQGDMQSWRKHALPLEE